MIVTAGATTTVWLILSVLLGGMAILTVWSRVKTRVRFWSVIGLLMGSPIAAGALLVSLGWPIMYVPGLTFPEGKTYVLGAKMLVGDGIYVLLDRGDSPPRYVWIPWDPKTANELQSAQDEAGKYGDVTITTPPFEWSWDRHPQFHALPQPKVLPDKPHPQEVPEVDSDSI